VRNSSLVEECRAENVTGLKFAAEAVDCQVQGWKLGSQWLSQWRNSDSSEGNRRRDWRVKSGILWRMPGSG